MTNNIVALDKAIHKNKWILVLQLYYNCTEISKKNNAYEKLEGKIFHMIIIVAK